MGIKHVIMCGLILLHFASASTKKTRLCVEYEIPNYWADEGALLVFCSLKRMHCMARCAHQSLCRAYNFRSTDGNCRLLPESPSCMTPNITEGWLYVALSTCSNHLPRRSTRPADGRWKWITVTDNPKGRSDIVQFSGRFPCRAFYKGLYIPGWWGAWPGQGVFRVALPHEKKKLTCMVGEFLVFLDPAEFVWDPMNNEYPVPANAVIGGYTPEWTPLYVARRLVGSRIMPGFYNAANKMFQISNDGYKEYTTGDLLLNVWRLYYEAHDCSVYHNIKAITARRIDVKHCLLIINLL